MARGARRHTGGRLFQFRTHSVDCSFARSLNDFKILTFTEALVRRHFHRGGIGFRGRITESRGLLNECYQPSVQKAIPANLCVLNLKFGLSKNVLPISWLANLPVIQVDATQLSYIWIWKLHKFNILCFIRGEKNAKCSFLFTKTINYCTQFLESGVKYSHA